MKQFETIIETLNAQVEHPLGPDYSPFSDCIAKNHLHLVINILQTLDADTKLIVVFIYLHAIRQTSETQIDWKKLEKDQQTLLQDLLNIDQSEWLINPKSSNAEVLRRLLLVLVRDVRVVLILLADQLALMRQATEFPETQQIQLSRSTMTYHAPLANRLGVWQVKWELEDLSFRFLQPQEYKQIAKQLDEKRMDREQFILRCKSRLHSELSKHSIAADIAGRPKHIYSIYRKMQKKNLSFSNLFDVQAIRVLVDTLSDCYATLGVVHATWKHIPKEFDDYIAQPKGNMYQSLHTVVVTESGKTLEVQIRTHQMHAHAELGVAAHWKYKEGSKHDQAFDNKVNWMRQLLNDENQDVDLLARFQSETQEDRVYVFTPNGDVIDLPNTSTPVDFAYHVHTEVGHRCQGAKINGSIVPLTYQLNTGDRVEILTGKHPNPSRDWLREQSGYLNTPRARAKVRHWFRENEFDKNVLNGKEVLESELKKYALEQVNLDSLLESFNLREVDRMYAMVATGDISVSQIIRRAEHQIRPQSRKIVKTNDVPTTSKPASGEFLIEGVNDLKTSVASCCQPILGDGITGFITRSRGISIHRNDCENLHHMINEEPDRLISVSWLHLENSFTKAHLTIEALERKNFIKDLTAILANNQANIEAINTTDQDTDGLRIITLTIQVKDFDHLSRIIDRISSLQGLTEVRRTVSH